MVPVMLFFSTIANAQTDTSKAQAESFNEMSLESLLNVEVSVASVNNTTQRESPGIVTVITTSEIEAMAANDITDVLKRIPGFDFGCDVEGVIGLGIRGNWAHEGKVLLMINGVELNESLYSTLQFGYNYPVSLIEKIEIIRGPGSAMYGGAAAYAVIDIKLKSPQKDRAVIINSSTSAFYNALASQTNSVFIGNKGSNYSYAVSAANATAVRSNRTYTDVLGNEYDMIKNSSISNKFLSAQIIARDYKLDAVIYDNTQNTRDGYHEILSKSYPLNFKASHFQLSKKFDIHDNFSVTPIIRFKEETPWQFNDKSYEDEFPTFDIKVRKWRGDLNFCYSPSPKVTFNFGGDFSDEKAKDNVGILFRSNNKFNIEYHNTVLYVQAVIKTNLANITAGCRANFNTLYNNTFVPRVAVTKAWKNTHVKALMSMAYRAPSIQNIDANPKIKPEESATTEIEVGTKISDKFALLINGFNMATSKTIIYSFNEETGLDSYKNSCRSGTRGFEADLKYKNKADFLGVVYSFYSPVGKLKSKNYSVPQNPDVLLAFPAHKTSVYACISLNNKLSVYSELLFKGPRYGVTGYNTYTEERYYQKFNATTTFDIILNYKGVVKNLDLSLGVKNLTNANDMLIQPYYDLHAPIPGHGREFLLKLNYKINLL